MADNRDFRPWESGLRIDLPEFQGGLTPEEFLDWVAAMDEVLEFKQVPEDKRVLLVATRFRGRAAAWWQQLKQTRMRQGKDKISSWEKLKKKMRVAFLPHNYSRLMYQRLQNLRQNSRSVDDYTTEFHQLVARNDLAETEEQLVSRPSSTPWSATARPTIGNTSTKPIASLPPTNPPAIRAGASSGSGSKCFKCGEPGHRAFECRKGERPGKALFVDSDGIVNKQCESYEQEAAYDEEVVEEVVGDNGPLLVVRRLCYAPREADGDLWLREKQAIRRPSSTPWSATAQPTVGNTSTKPIASLPPTNPPAIRAGASSGSSSGSKCFKCGEPGHRAVECRKGERPGKALFVDSDGIVNKHCESYEQEAAYDEEVVEEVVGDNEREYLRLQLPNVENANGEGFQCGADLAARGSRIMLNCGGGSGGHGSSIAYGLPSSLSSLLCVTKSRDEEAAIIFS
ncbi:hypothetical protein Vadar_001255 [Vaccinium darrowii]|uniref:Uncharacterized protein n=1 Tax=Vaccinium darrowii TaxID=229202 RepID=A0ACB7X6X6_9ERIC|nr:hypothetical protein Vadar_001255 [Vaccinium darrowii]